MLGLSSSPTVQAVFGTVMLVGRAAGYLNGYRDQRCGVEKGKQKPRLELHYADTWRKVLPARYILGNTKTQEFDPSNGMVKSLVATNILYVPSQHFNIIEGMAFLIAPWAWEHLRKHPGTLSVTPAENEQLQKRLATKRRW